MPTFVCLRVCVFTCMCTCVQVHACNHPPGCKEYAGQFCCTLIQCILVCLEWQHRQHDCTEPCLYSVLPHACPWEDSSQICAGCLPFWNFVLAGSGNCQQLQASDTLEFQCAGYSPNHGYQVSISDCSPLLQRLCIYQTWQNLSMRTYALTVLMPYLSWRSAVTDSCWLADHSAKWACIPSWLKWWGPSINVILNPSVR